MFRLQHINVSFGAVEGGRGLQDICLDVPPGQIVALMGRNGCGKSTILRAIAGLVDISEGRISVGEVDLTVRSAAARAERVAFVSQETGVGLPLHLTVRDVLALCAAPHGSWWRDPRREVDWNELVAMLQGYLPHLQYRLDDQILSLSGGERQLLSLACIRSRLAILRPSQFVLLLDEPTASLDPVLASHVLREARLLVTHYDLSCILVCHSIELSLAFADRIVIIRDGVLHEHDRESADAIGAADGGRSLLLQAMG